MITPTSNMLPLVIVYIPDTDFSRRVNMAAGCWMIQYRNGMHSFFNHDQIDELCAFVESAI